MTALRTAGGFIHQGGESFVVVNARTIPSLPAVRNAAGTGPSIHRDPLAGRRAGQEEAKGEGPMRAAMYRDPSKLAPGDRYLTASEEERWA